MQKTLIGAIIAVVVVGGIAFYSGMSYAKGQAPQRGQFTSGQFGGRGGMGMRGGFSGGQIVSSGNGSITISLPNGSTQIVLVGTSTQILKSTQGSLSDLTQGANVIVNGTPNSDGSLTAQSIQLRPADTAGFGRAQPQTQTQ